MVFDDHAEFGDQAGHVHAAGLEIAALRVEHGLHCLLYTSDAADERSSVDLGGRRIIKKKKAAPGGAGHDVIEPTKQVHSHSQ